MGPGDESTDTEATQHVRQLNMGGDTPEQDEDEDDYDTDDSVDDMEVQGAATRWPQHNSIVDPSCWEVALPHTTVTTLVKGNRNILNIKPLTYKNVRTAIVCINCDG